MSWPAKVDVVIKIGAVLLLFFINNFCSAHVALTFPPARKYDLDFLDNFRTPGPCGMPKGSSRTTILAGSVFNVTWHLAYPHRGGFKLELLNGQGKPWMDLTPAAEKSDFIQTDATAQNHIIRVPKDLSCEDCSIRLKREALEWANNYTFWSCADIVIVSEDGYREDCSGNGVYKNGLCTCKKLYSGPRCQYKDECWEDKDCGIHGQCVDIDATSYPKKQCYCQLGWFGRQCNKESAIKSVDLDLSRHQKKDLSDNYKLYWKIIPSTNEIEVVMQVKSTTYVSLGWRPKGLTSACKAFPPIGEGVITPIESPLPELEPEPEPEPEAEPEPKDEPKAEPVNKEDNSRALPETTDFVAHKGNVTEVELETEPEPEATAEGTPHPEPESILEEQPVDSRMPITENRNNISEYEDVVDEADNSHSMAESNAHPVTLEVTAKPMVVSIVPEEETGAGRAEVADQGEVNYGIENTEDGSVEYSHLAETTPSPTRRMTVSLRHKRQLQSGNESAVDSTTKSSFRPIIRLKSLRIPSRQRSTLEPKQSSDLLTVSSIKPAVKPTSELVSQPKLESVTESNFKLAAQPVPKSTDQPIAEPVAEPTLEPTSEPAAEPTSEPAAELSSEPAAEPTSEPAAEPTSEPAAEPTSEPAAEPTSEPAAEPTSEPAAEPTSEPAAEPTSEPAAEPTSEPAAEPTSEPAAKPISKPAAEPISKPAAEPIPEPVAKPKLEPKSESEPTSEPIAEHAAEPDSELISGSNTTATRQSKARKENELAKSLPEYGSESEPAAEPSTRNEPTRTYPRGPYTPKGDYHAMDCTDIVTGMARGTFSRVLDLYTRDRSTPRDDTFWGGEDSLTSALGFEMDGITTIAFRRKLQTNDVTDHSIQDGLMHVIWAQGQETGAYVHSPPSGLERGKADVSDFYRRDEFKYHGHRTQRGITAINFMEESKQVQMSHLRGEWKIPKSCTINDCEYRATWELIPAKDSIIFTVSTNNSDKWTGIGFSEDGKMPNTDAILGWVDDAGRTFVMDTWIDQYGPPILDEYQDVDNIKGSKINGRVTLSFMRKRNTGDSKNDLAFTNSSCLYLVFPYDGGVFNAVNKKIRKHNSVPAVSDTKICIDGSGKVETPGTEDLLPPLSSVPDTIPTTAWPSSTLRTIDSSKATWIYLVAIRLPNQTLDDAIERGSDLEMLIRERLTSYMNSALSNLDGFDKVEVTNLESEKNESHVVAKMRVFIDPKGSMRTQQKESSALRQLKAALNNTISKGKVGSLLVDPAYLSVQPLEVEELNEVSNADDERTLLAKSDESLLYVIIAAVVVFGVLLLIQIICMIYRWRAVRKTRVSKERLIAGAGWKDYAASGGYGYEHFASNEETPKINKQPYVGSSNGTSRSKGQGNSANNGHSKSGNMQPGETRSLNRNARAGPAVIESERNNHYSRRSESLPRPMGPSGGGYGSHAPHERGSRPSSSASHHPQGGLQPDFYFMPSQRRYSGEVVRVYVDYTNPNYTGK